LLEASVLPSAANARLATARVCPLRIATSSLGWPSKRSSVAIFAGSSRSSGDWAGGSARGGEGSEHRAASDRVSRRKSRMEDAQDDEVTGRNFRSFPRDEEV